MESEKYENLFNLALDTPQNEREKSQNLSVGYDSLDNRWDLIVKYNGRLSEALSNISDEIRVSELLGGYAVLNVPQRFVDSLSSLPEIEFVEQPKRLYFAIDQARSISCINQVQVMPYNLSGRGVCFALIDSGIDYTHPDFRNEDGTSRILYLWDQTINGNAPQGYYIGSEFDRQQINEALLSGNSQISVDSSGHGTAVAGAAVGNGRSSNGRYRGVAPEADIIVVKLGVPNTTSFPRTTELMLAVDYCIRKAQQINMPVAINISFGNNYGSHDGSSLLETYLDEAASVWKNVICVGTGNEGAAAGHFAGLITNNETQRIEFVVGPYEETINIQLWKNYVDDFEVYIVDPSSNRVALFSGNEIQRFSFPNTEVLVYYGRPKPYSVNQEIYMDFLPKDDFINEGVWSVEIIGKNITVGTYNMWLPVREGLSAVTEFLRPSPVNTLTSPSASARVITVAAYDGKTDSYADFSGRGCVTNCKTAQKPDIAAPGVDIISTKIGGGYAVYNGTSFATPIVTGSACLLMEYGIVQGRDIYLYGEKIKASLIKGARKLPGIENWPNDRLGYGALCLRNSII